MHMSKCLSEDKLVAFIFSSQPMPKPKDFSCLYGFQKFIVTIIHSRQKIIPELIKVAWFSGYFTNHNLHIMYKSVA